MNAAIQELETIYSTVLVKECHPVQLQQFKSVVEQIKYELNRKNRVLFYVKLLKDGRLEEWRRLYDEAHEDWKEKNMSFSLYPWHMRDHEWSVIGESMAIYEKEEKEKKLTEQKLKEEELLEEAKRRLAERDRELTIQALMTRLTEEQVQQGSQ